MRSRDLMCVLLCVWYACHVTCTWPPTCAEVSREPLEVIPGCSLSARDSLHVHVTCPGDHVTPDLRFKVLQPSGNSSGQLTWCVGLSKAEVTAASQVTSLVLFDHQVPVGTVGVDGECWEGDRSSSCACRLSVSPRVRALGVVSATPCTPTFWAMEAEPLQAPAAWLRTLVTSSGCVGVADVRELRGCAAERVVITDGNLGEGVMVPPMPRLRELQMIGSGVRGLHPDSFVGTPNVEELVLSSNQLTVIPPVVRRLSLLTILILDSNNATNFTVDTRLLSSLQQLDTLSLSYNNVSAFADNVPTMVRLRRLLMDGCQLTHLRADAFNNVPLLTVLSLSNNRLQVLDDNVLLPLRDLEFLSLSNCSLQQWPKWRTPLSSLDLSWNLLTSLPHSGIVAYTVGYVDLAGNNVTGWRDAFVFCRPASTPCLLTWVTSLNLSYNGVRHVTASMTSSLRRLRSVDLGGNPLACDACDEVSGLHAAATATAMATIFYNLATLRSLLCASPPQLRGVPVMAAAATMRCGDNTLTVVMVSALAVLVIAVVICHQRAAVRYYVGVLCAATASRGQLLLLYRRAYRKYVMGDLLPGLRRHFRCRLYELDSVLTSRLLGSPGDHARGSTAVLLISPDIVDTGSLGLSRLQTVVMIRLVLHHDDDDAVTSHHDDHVICWRPADATSRNDVIRRLRDVLPPSGSSERLPLL